MAPRLIDSLRRFVRRPRRRGRVWLVRGSRLLQGRFPWLRPGLPFVLAILLNVGFGALLIAFSFDRTPRGTPDAVQVARVFSVSPAEFDALSRPEEPEEEEEEDEETPLEPPSLEEEQAAAEAPEEAETAERADAPLAEEAPDEEGIALPDVALPKTDRGFGAPDGVVALDCKALFAGDPDKAAECAGREILSGWRADVADLGEDWDRIGRELRRGGVPIPAYGPDDLANLGRNESIYAPDDPRFDTEEFNEFARRHRAFASEAEIRRYYAHYDQRRYISMHESAFADQGTPPAEPLSGWRPSWMLREDPVVDNRALERMMREIEAAEGE